MRGINPALPGGSMRKNGIDIIRIRAAAADEPQTEARVSFELAKFLRDESLKYLEKATRRPQLQRTKLYAYLKAVEKKRSLVKHEILECTRSRASGEIVLAVSEATRRRIRQAALARFEPIEKLRKKLLDLIKRADAKLLVLDEERRNIMRAYYRQIARHVETRSHRRAAA